MRLLAIEARQNATYYVSRYEQVERLGVELFILNGEGSPDFWAADHYRVVGSRNVDDIVQQARDWHAMHRFEGVLTFSESAVNTVAVVAEALGLPGIGSAAARTSRNKFLMRQAHERAGAPHPRFRLVHDADGAAAAAADFGFPLVIKPTLGAASNFVFRIDNLDQLRARYAEAAEGIDAMSWFAMEGTGIDLGPQGILVESFLDGREFLIEALVWDDELFLGSVVDRVTAEGDTFDDDVHAAPTSLGAQELALVHAAVAAGARAQGLRRSVMHAEVRFHHGKPHLLEIAARPGGGGLDHIARLTAGYCPIKAMVEAARGVRPTVGPYRPTGTHIAALCLLCPAGRLEAVDVPDDIVHDPRVFFLKITARVGDQILRPPDGNSILGFLGTTGPSRAEALRTAAELASRIQARLYPDTPQVPRRPSLIPA
jgi:biotin carboxylase